MQRQGTVGDGMKGVPVNVVTAEKEKEKARADAELDEMLQMERECSQSQWGEEPPFEEPKSAYNSYKDKNTTQPYSQPQPSFSQPFPQSTYSQPSNSQPLSQPTPTYTQPTYSQQPLSQPTQPTFQPTFFQPSTSGFQAGATIQGTLTKFGLPSFRQGQAEVIAAALRGGDSAVFWATGMGKSLCYQIPALHSGKPAFIISPLISLMQDQCIKLNNLTRSSIATYLGSGQTDPQAETRALNGEHLLVYLTPEKATSGGFIDSLARLQRTRGLSLIAIDEAHCVSEWGHSFRPTFRQLHLLREHSGLRGVPIMALTATAVPRVQRDIIHQLHLQQPYIALSSFDRPNLRLVVHRKPAGGRGAAFDPLIKALVAKPTDNSTIVYCPTQKEVQMTADMLTEQLRGVCNVLPYHAGLPPCDREEAHRGFLTGRVQIIVATVAFGMGIDKPDTRRVMHWGCPKTVEEYYQQVGRAGRDGLAGECTMFADLNDFTRYRDDFYVGSLGAQAKAATLASLDALQHMCMSETQCRRHSLLTFFEETPTFQTCGNCDNCLNALKYGNNQRDFAAPARVVLVALAGLKPCAMSVLEKVTKGVAVEDYRYRLYGGARGAQEAVKRAREAPGADVVPDLLRNLLPSLVEGGYVLQEMQKSQGGQGYAAKSYVVYALAAGGDAVLRGAPCLLRVPEAVREAERTLEEKRQQIMNKLSQAGVDIASIPETELLQGGGAVMDAYGHFYAIVERERLQNPLKAEALLQLKSDIIAWRAATAERLIMAPAAVLPEHLVCKIAYVCSRGPLSEKSLSDIGVRVVGTAELAEVTVRWCLQHGVAQMGGAGGAMVLPSSFKPRAWALAQYTPAKTWEASAERFVRGESLAAIAINQGVLKGGGQKKPILASTVGNHLLDALSYGKHTVDLMRLGMEYPPPSSDQWAALRGAEAQTGIDVTTTAWAKGDFLRGPCPSAAVPFNERSEEDKASNSHWQIALNWYTALRRAAYEPQFLGAGEGQEQKRQRVN